MKERCPMNVFVFYGYPPFEDQHFKLFFVISKVTRQFSALLLHFTVKTDHRKGEVQSESFKKANRALYHKE